jgi:glycosyltransferase involved in cell wall biosynthesis
MEQGTVIFLVTHSAQGGAQEIWMDLAEGFVAAGYRAQLMTLYPAPDHREASSQHQWRKVRDARPATIAGAVGLVVALARILRRDRPDMVFTAMPAANIVAPIAALLAGVGTRVCISHHSPVSTHRRMLDLIDNITGTLSCIRSVITVSDAVGRSLDGKPLPYQRKRTTIHNALPPRIEAQLCMLRALRTTRASDPDRRRRVVAAGRLSEEKNYPVLLRAAARLPDVDVVIVGSGPLETFLKQFAAASDAAARVHFTGQLTREATLEMLASADVFVQPSVFEGHSLALLEAARLGIPVIVSDVPAQIEAITLPDGARCGIAVGLHDDKALADTVRRLLDDPAYYRHWADAASWLAGEATYAHMVSSYRMLLAP